MHLSVHCIPSAMAVGWQRGAYAATPQADISLIDRCKSQDLYALIDAQAVSSDKYQYYQADMDLRIARQDCLSFGEGTDRMAPTLGTTPFSHRRLEARIRIHSAAGYGRTSRHTDKLVGFLAAGTAMSGQTRPVSDYRIGPETVEMPYCGTQVHSARRCRGTLP